MALPVSVPETANTDTMPTPHRRHAGAAHGGHHHQRALAPPLARPGRLEDAALVGLCPVCSSLPSKA